MTGSPRADLIIGGRIATLAGESGLGWAEGIAIAAGRVIAVGPPHELDALASAGTRRWTLPSDQAVIPGITDAHLHLMTLTLAATQIDLNGMDLAQALDAVARRHKLMLDAGDDESWLLGHGWSAHTFGSWPDAAALERAAPGRHVVLMAHDHHSRWFSPAALRAAGVTAASPDPDGGRIRRDAAGEPSGILHETAGALADAVIPQPPEAVIEASLEDVAAQLAALGVTGCHDPGELSGDREINRGPILYRRLAEEGRLPLRVHACVRSPQLPRALELGLRSGESLGRYTMGWLKLFADGALGSRSAALLAPYDDAAVNPPTGSPSGMFVMPPEELAADTRAAEQAGIATMIHAIGDLAVRAVLDVFESIPANPTLVLGRRVEHAQLVDPADQPRFGKLGVAASFQPSHLISDTPQIHAGWGQRGNNAFPLRAIADGGALIPFGTDAPVEQPDPWPGIAAAIARRDPANAGDAQLGPQHAIGLDRAIRAACLDPALVAGLTDLGRLTAGMRADLLVVPAAGLDEPHDTATLARTRPLATLIDGEVVFRDPSFSG